MESVAEGGRSGVLKTLEGGVSGLNPDATEGHTQNTTTVPYLE
jgi:hypothetical protein